MSVFVWLAPRVSARHFFWCSYEHVALWEELWEQFLESHVWPVLVKCHGTAEGTANAAASGVSPKATTPPNQNVTKVRKTERNFTEFKEFDMAEVLHHQSSLCLRCGFLINRVLVLTPELQVGCFHWSICLFEIHPRVQRYLFNYKVTPSFKSCLRKL